VARLALVVSVKPRATGYTHIETDGGVATRLQFVAPMEFAHVALALPLPDMLNRLAYDRPRRGTDVTS
jgi:hypothetical protein